MRCLTAPLFGRPLTHQHAGANGSLEQTDHSPAADHFRLDFENSKPSAAPIPTPTAIPEPMLCIAAPRATPTATPMAMPRAKPLPACFPLSPFSVSSRAMSPPDSLKEQEAKRLTDTGTVPHIPADRRATAPSLALYSRRFCSNQLLGARRTLERRPRPGHYENPNSNGVRTFPLTEVPARERRS